MWSSNAKHQSKQQGQAQVEFLLSVIALIIVMMWVLQFMLLIYDYVVLAGAAKQGVRYAVVHGTYNSVSATAVENVVKNYAGFDAITVNVSYEGGSTGVNKWVRVTVSYPFVSLFNFGWSPPILKAAAQGRIIY